MSTPALATRLAPSPTGALHLGNARTFLLTWALARRSGCLLWLRIEDLDTNRTKPGAAAEITRTLTWLGCDWDPWTGAPDGVLVQSRDLTPYRDAMRRLAAAALVYPCELTRKEVESAASAPQESEPGMPHETPYPAHLRPPLVPLDFDAEEAGRPEGVNWRFATPDADVVFTDHFAGPQRINPARTIGDFVVWTKRRRPAYQLAVVVDDHRQGVTHVVRGDDLLDSAARQLALFRALGLPGPEPAYCHLPLVRGTDGRRLAKRHGDTRVDMYRALGVHADAIVGLIAGWSGAGPERHRCSPRSLLDALELSTIPKCPVVFTSEDDRWLRASAGG